MEWSPSHSASYYVILAALVAASLLLARRFAKVPAGRSLLLFGLRAAVLTVLLVILLEPVRVTSYRGPEQPPAPHTSSTARAAWRWSDRSAGSTGPGG